MCKLCPNDNIDFMQVTRRVTVTDTRTSELAVRPCQVQSKMIERWDIEQQTTESIRL